MRFPLQKRRECGYSLLEYAAVLPIVLFLILGAFDVNKMLQGYTALQEGVKISLRCSYTTDGKCTEVDIPSAPNRLFDFYRSKARWSIPYYNYSGEGSWIEKPLHWYGQPVAEVLDQVSYSIERQPGVITKPRHRGVPVFRHWTMTAKIPYADTGQNRTDALNPTFVYADDTDSGYTPIISTSLKTQSGSRISGRLESSEGKRTKRIGIFRYDFPDDQKDDQGLKCFVSQQMAQDSEAAHTPKYNMTDKEKEICNYNRVRLAFHVTGDSTCDSGGEGKVKIYYNNQPEGTEDLRWRPLGGREIDSGSSGNFYPRGLGEPDVTNTHGEQEFDLHDVIFARRKNPVRIKFELERDRGNIGWRGENISIFVSEFKVTEHKGECWILNSSERTSCTIQAVHKLADELGANRQEKTGIVLALVATEQRDEFEDFCDDKGGTPVLEEACGLPGVDPGQEDRQNQCNDWTFEERPTTANLECGRFIESRTCCQNADTDSSCNNFGVAGNPNGDAREAAEAICPVPEDLVELVDEDTIRWTTHPVGVAQDAGVFHPDPTLSHTESAHLEFGLIEPDCKRLSGDEEITRAAVGATGISQLSSYPNLKWGIKGRVDREYKEALYTGDVSPQEYKEAHPQVSACPVVRKQYDFEPPIGRSPVDLSSTSIFAGDHRVSCDWENELQQDAKTNCELPDSAYFEPNRESSYHLYEDEQPTDECLATLLPDADERGDEEAVAGGPYPEGVTPEACHEPGWFCRAVFAGFDGDFRVGTGPEVLEEVAEAWGYDEVEASLPWVKRGCRDEESCVHFKVKAPEEEDKDKIIYSTATLWVPLTLLAGNSVPLTYRAHERQETEFAR